MVLVSLAVIRVAAPDVYDQALRLPPSWPRWAGTAFLVGLVAFIALLAVGVLRRSRRIFWLILLAFLAGVLRVPVAILQLTHVLSTNVPSWYVVFQGFIGLAQLAIGLAHAHRLPPFRRLGSGLSGAAGTLRDSRPGAALTSAGALAARSSAWNDRPSTCSAFFTSRGARQVSPR